MHEKSYKICADESFLKGAIFGPSVHIVWDISDFFPRILGYFQWILYISYIKKVFHKKKQHLKHVGLRVLLAVLCSSIGTQLRIKGPATQVFSAAAFFINWYYNALVICNPGPTHQEIAFSSIAFLHSGDKVQVTAQCPLMQSLRKSQSRHFQHTAGVIEKSLPHNFPPLSPTLTRLWEAMPDYKWLVHKKVHRILVHKCKICSMIFNYTWTIVMCKYDFCCRISRTSVYLYCSLVNDAAHFKNQCLSVLQSSECCGTFQGPVFICVAV